MAAGSLAFLVYSADRSNPPPDAWLAHCECHLRAACLVLGDARDPLTIGVPDIEVLDQYLATTPLIFPGVKSEAAARQLVDSMAGYVGSTSRHLGNCSSGCRRYTTRREAHRVVGVQTRYVNEKSRYRVTTLEQTLVDTLHRPHSCGGPAVVFEA